MLHALHKIWRFFSPIIFVATLAGLVWALVVNIQNGNIHVGTGAPDYSKIRVPATTSAPAAANISPRAPASEMPSIDCVTPGPAEIPYPPALRPHTIAVTLYAPADKAASYMQLRKLRGSKYTEVVYAGPYVDAGDQNATHMAAYIDEATCDGFQVSMQLSSEYKVLADGDVMNYWATLAGGPHSDTVDGPFLSANLAPKNPADGQYTTGRIAINRWYGQLTSLHGKQIHVMSDFPGTGDPATDKAQLFSYQADAHLPIYLPEGAPAGYGPVDAYPQVGDLIWQKEKKASWGAVQAKGYPHSPAPTADQITDYTRMLTQDDHPITNILVYTENPWAHDDYYLIAAAQAVWDGMHSNH